MEFTAFKGLRNNVSWERQEAGDLETATNVYLDDTGRLARRNGTTQVVAGATHSLFADGGVCLFAQGTSLKRLWTDNTTTVLRTDLSGEPVSYWDIGGIVY
jgi:hypothetical protein